jgi:hypothetical protein
MPRFQGEGVSHAAKIVEVGFGAVNSLLPASTGSNSIQRRLVESSYFNRASVARIAITYFNCSTMFLRMRAGLAELF